MSDRFLLSSADRDAPIVVCMSVFDLKFLQSVALVFRAAALIAFKPTRSLKMFPPGNFLTL